MSRKTLLVLAASQYQLEVITTAKRLGYRVLTTDNQPDNPGHKLADRAYNVNTVDREAILQLATAEQVNGIIAACTDVSVPTAAYVAERLGLPGPNIRCAEIVTNKLNFRRFLSEQNIACPEWFSVDANSVLEPRTFGSSRWVLKPDVSSGSKGVFILDSLADFIERLPETLGFSPNGRGILEEFIDGVQGTCEGFLFNDKLSVVCFLDRQTASPPYVTTCGHHLPTRLSESQQSALLHVLTRLWSTLGISSGPFDCDFVMAAPQPFIIEMSPRIGGNAIAALLRKATNFDIVECSVKLACGDLHAEPRAGAVTPAAVVLLGVFKTGRLFFDTAAADTLRTEKWVDSLSFDRHQGEQVQVFSNGRHRIGEAFICGVDRDDIDSKVVELTRRLDIRVVE